MSRGYEAAKSNEKLYHENYTDIDWSMFKKEKKEESKDEPKEEEKKDDTK